MAAVRTTDGVASVAPAGAPDTLQRINATSEAFGAAEGRAQEQGAREMQGLGQSLGQAAQTGFQLHDYFDQVQTDHVINGALDAGFKTVSSYKTLQGQAALDARADTEKQLDEIFTNARKGLKDQSQADDFDKAAAGYRRTLGSDISTHATGAARQFATDTNKAAGTLALKGIATYADDDAQFNNFWADARRSAVQQVIVEGNGADRVQVRAALSAADEAAFKTRIQTIGVKNPQRASELAEAHKDRLGMSYDNISNEMRTRAAEQRGLEVVSKATGVVAGKLQAAPTEAAKSAYTQATFDQESGDSGVNPGQITPDTWKRWEAEGIVRPGQSYANPADTRDVAKRATAMYYDKYQDPARAAVAWFSGPGNVAPEGSAQPFIRDVSDKNGKSVSSYVQDITNRVGGPVGTQLAVRANMMDAILDMTKDDPHARRVAVREFTEQAKAAETASLTNQAAVKAQNQSLMTNIYNEIGAGKTVNLYDPKFSSLPVEEREKLREIQNKALTSRISGDVSNPGDGYAKAHEDIRSGAIKNQEQLGLLAHQGVLTPWGLSDLSKNLEEFRKPGNEGEKMLETGGWKFLRQSITLFDESSQRDLIPGSTEKWNKAVPMLQDALRQGHEKGLTNAQLFSPDSKDYIGKALPPNFYPTKNEQVAAAIDADHKTVAKFDPTTVKTLDDAQKAWASRDINREQMIDLVRAHPEWKIRPPGAAVPVVPNTTPGP